MKKILMSSIILASVLLVSTNISTIVAQTSNSSREINCGINPHAPPCCLQPTNDPSCLEVPSTFGSFLSGAFEVPPVETNATGLVFLTHYETNDPIKDVMNDIVRYDISLRVLTPLLIHIHQGQLGENGSIVATLYTSGILRCCSPREITGDDLEGPLKGKPISALLDLMNSGNVYIDVHTGSFSKWRNRRAHKSHYICFTRRNTKFVKPN